jgi:hypothetical protein
MYYQQNAHRPYTLSFIGQGRLYLSNMQHLLTISPRVHNVG